MRPSGEPVKKLFSFIYRRETVRNLVRYLSNPCGSLTTFSPPRERRTLLLHPVDAQGPPVFFLATKPRGRASNLTIAASATSAPPWARGCRALGGRAEYLGGLAACCTCISSHGLHQNSPSGPRLFESVSFPCGGPPPAHLEPGQTPPSLVGFAQPCDHTPVRIPTKDPSNHRAIYSHPGQ